MANTASVAMTIHHVLSGRPQKLHVALVCLVTTVSTAASVVSAEVSTAPSVGTTVGIKGPRREISLWL
ncbi:hypothetical protein Hanom_Chr17g01569351 [Helianthus anomalus]